MIAIYKRELKAYMNTVIGPLVIAADLFLIGMYYVVYNLFDGYPYYGYTLEGASFLLLIAMPFLTMRIFSEERRNKTDQLILTAPVSLTKIVLGKFLAAVSIYAVPILISCIYPALMTKYGKVPLGEAYLAIIGFFFFGVVCIAIGTFISALFENQIIAAIVTFLALFLGYMMESLCLFISDKENVFTKILGLYDIYTPMNSFMGGVFDLTAAIFDISIIILFLFLTVQVIQKRRFTFSSKKPAFGAYSIIGIIVAVFVFALINIGSQFIPAKFAKIDCTYNKMYKLSDTSKEFLSSLDEDVHIFVLMNEIEYDSAVAQTLEYIDSESSHISLEYIDTTENPRFYAQFSDVAPNAGSIILVSDKRSKVVDFSVLYESTVALNYYTYEYETQYTGYDAEAQIVAGIDYVCKDDIPVMYISEGHEEYDFDYEYYSILDSLGIDYDYCNLAEVDGVPANATTLFINGPAHDFTSDEVQKIIDYLDRGGNVILTITVSEEPFTNLNKVLSYMNMTVETGVVVEEDYNYYYNSPYYDIPVIYYCDYTSTLNEYGYNVISILNAGIALGEEKDGLSYNVFLESSENSFLLKDYLTVTSYTHDESDKLGPFPLAVEAVRENTAEDGSIIESKMVVYASSMIFSTEVDELSDNANLILFNNTVGAFVTEDEMGDIPSKSFALDYLVPTWNEMVTSAVVLVAIIPVVIILAGVVVWVIRKRR